MRRSSLLKSRMAAAEKKVSGAALGIGGAAAYQDLFPRASTRQLSREMPQHAGKLKVASSNLVTAGERIVAAGKKGLAHMKNSSKRRVRLKGYRRKIPLRTVPKR